MCGIAGLFDPVRSPRERAAVVRRMIAIQRHRGPDGEGFLDGGPISIGHCRLAILGLGPDGHQPMCDPSGRFWLTFNGEIYNFVELRKELASEGWSFRGSSDTEVLLASYVTWGEACLERLRGMFAFGIWDDTEKRVFLARDRLGIKPLYYAFPSARTSFAFASELKAVAWLLPERRADIELARDYVAWNLLGHEADRSFVQGVRQLKPAHSLTWVPGEDAVLSRFWDLQVTDESSTSDGGKSDFVNGFKRVFEDSIDCHLRSDVPVGTCLSGGLDSASIAVVVKDTLVKRGRWVSDWQHAFTARFPDPSLDESRFADAVVQKTGCQQHVVWPEGRSLGDEVERWLWYLDEPVGGTNAYAQFQVCRLAREHGVKVLLDGQGADEQLAGYRKFILVYLKQLVGEGRFIQAATELAHFASVPILKTTRWVDGLRYLPSFGGGSDDLWVGGSRPQRPVGLGFIPHLGERIQLDLTRFSLPVLLRYEDRNSMAHGVEARVPFVDHRLVEFVAAMPADLRLNRGWTKWVLREALADLLPEVVRFRKSKLGFSTPEDDWISGPLSGWIMETLGTPRFLGDVVELSGVKRLRMKFEKNRTGPTERRMAFRLAAFETWARLFLGDTGNARFSGFADFAE